MEKGIELHQFDKENKEGLEETLGKLSLSDSEKYRIKQDIEAGHLITIPDEDVTIGSWTGTGYISLDKTTGAGAYMISGSLNGGAKPAIATGMAVYALIMEFGSAYFLINALSLVLVPGIIKLAGVALIMQGIYVINMMLIAYIDYMATHDEAYFDQFVNWFLKSGLISSIQLECAYLLLSIFWVAEACDDEKEENNAEVETDPETNAETTPENTPETTPDTNPETIPETNPVAGQTGGEEENAGEVVSKTVSVDYNGASTSVYRGGNDFSIKPNEVKINKSTGNVKTTHGVSINVDPNNVSKFGGAYKIESIPEGLKIVQRGAKPEHFEIVPEYEMPLEEFQNLLNQIEISGPY